LVFREAVKCEDHDDVSVAWDEQRRLAVDVALEKMLLPLVERDLRDQLKQEAELFVTEQCANFVRGRVNRAPYVAAEHYVEDTDSESLRVLGIAVRASAW